MQQKRHQKQLPAISSEMASHHTTAKLHSVHEMLEEIVTGLLQLLMITCIVYAANIVGEIY